MRTDRVQYLFVSTTCALFVSGAAPASTGRPVESIAEIPRCVADSRASSTTEVCETDLRETAAESGSILTDGARFTQLAGKWRDKIRYSSSLRRGIMQPEYWDIIKMDKAALPFIFAEMTGSRWADWLFALRVITDQTFGTPESNVGEIREAWLNWGRENGYLAA